MNDIVTMELSDIDDSHIHREDMGDIPGLAESIVFLGLLQYPGTNEKGELLWGKRRLAAMKLLGWEHSEFKLMTGLSPTDRLKVEQAENEQRKDYTPSEKVSIGQAIEESLGNRQGQRTDLELRENFPQVKGKTREHVAKEAGFGNDTTYRQAKAVVETGDGELIEQMDSGEKSIHAAYTETKPREKMVELELEFSDDVETSFDMLGAAIHRCCNKCDEAEQVYKHLRGIVL